MNRENKQLFDAASAAYDRVFTHSKIGKLERKRVYYWLKKKHFFSTPKKIFEINCGTGYDAELMHNKGHQVVSTDISPKMIEIARKARKKEIDFFTLDFQKVHLEAKFQESNVLFSNFGGLNCLKEEELEEFLLQVGHTQQKGSWLIMVIMAKKCFMEDLYHVATFRWNKLGQRNNSKGLSVNVDGEQVHTYYHAPKAIEQTLLKNYDSLLIRPVAFFIPPSYLEPLFKNNAVLLRLLYGLEKTMGNLKALAAGADHYIVIAKKS